MAVMAREAWTDERLDDLKVGLDRRFDQVDKRLDRLDDRLDSLQRTIIIGFATTNASVIGALLLT